MVVSCNYSIFVFTNYFKLFKYILKQCITLTGRNTTGPPCSVGCPTPLTQPPAHRPSTRPAGPTTGSIPTPRPNSPGGRQRYRRRRRQTPASKKYWPIRRVSNNTDSLVCKLHQQTVKDKMHQTQVRNHRIILHIKVL